MRNVRIAAMSVALAPALSLTAPAQSYALDDGKPGVYQSLGGPFPTFADESGIMQAFSVPGGGSDRIESISIAFSPFWYFDAGSTQTIDGADVRVAVWSDPNGDKNPSDAVLLGVSGGHVAQNTGSGQFVTYTLPTPVSVTGSFFIGATLEATFGPLSTATGAIDESQGYQWDSWYFSNDAGPIDVVQLSQNSQPPTNVLLTGRYLLRANDGDYGVPIGSNLCLAFPNSDGVRGELTATGNLDSSVGPWRVVLTATYVPRQSFGVFIASKAVSSPVTPPGSVGRLCLSGSMLLITESLQSTDSRMMIHDVDLMNVDGVGAGVPGVDAVLAGETWYFQGWHRDLDPTPTSNFTSVLEVAFQ
ncbi:MAG: hypothetical protein AAFU73_18060 [Planctomycetota bacterium]